ncbi:MAG: RNB domain-containing ribonuclease [Kiritimatiellaeota bacterium]|nr:RNB domain-containing ribonuclease [Kiritimatiellota bacterium]
MRRNSSGRDAGGTMRGIYVGHVRGFGFFVPENQGKDLFVPPGREGDAVDGDTVEVRALASDAACVVRVLERGRPLLAGTYAGRGAVVPDAHRIPKMLRVEGKAEKGDKVLVAASPGGFSIQRVLGRSGAPEVEDAAVLAELDIAPEFPESVPRTATALRPPEEAILRRRLDLRDRCTVVTIDPLTSRDFDDAVSLEQQKDGWLLGVHIADVSFYVRPGDPIDVEARRRGTSVYLPNRVIPMLPERLSNDLCSLREGVDRLTLSVLLRYDREGRLQETTFAESVIRSDRRYSYERASRIMEGRRGRRGRTGEMLRQMGRLASQLKRRRRSLDFARNETELVYNGAGDVVDLHSTAEDAAHGVIEEFMLAANREVARLMLSRGVPVLYRHHPDPPDLGPVWDTLTLLGIEAPRRLGLRRALAKAVKAGFGPAAASALFRCMPRAVYTTRAASHFSLGFDSYLHFTSPIRRYPDLIVHRRLREILRAAGGTLRVPPPARLPTPKPDAALEELGKHANLRSLGAERAEARIRRRRVLEFLLRQGGIPTEGQVTTVIEKGLVVDLPEYGISGFLAVELLPGGPFRLEPGALQGRKRAYRLGDTLEVQIHRIDPGSSQLDLALAPVY